MSNEVELVSKETWREWFKQKDLRAFWCFIGADKTRQPGLEAGGDALNGGFWSGYITPGEWLDMVDWAKELRAREEFEKLDGEQIFTSIRREMGRALETFALAKGPVPFTLWLAFWKLDRTNALELLGPSGYKRAVQLGLKNTKTHYREVVAEEDSEGSVDRHGATVVWVSERRYGMAAPKKLLVEKPEDVKPLLLSEHKEDRILGALLLGSKSKRVAVTG